MNEYDATELAFKNGYEKGVSDTKSEVDKLEYTLLGVMHSVDKWLEGDELEKDEVNRAITMREKTLRLIETANAEIERLQVECLALKQKRLTLFDRLEFVKNARAQAIKEFAERLRSHYPHTQSILKRIDCIEKEMTEG